MSKVFQKAFVYLIHHSAFCIFIEKAVLISEIIYMIMNAFFFRLEKIFNKKNKIYFLLLKTCTIGVHFHKHTGIANIR